jgi:hypothetical protein
LAIATVLVAVALVAAFVLPSSSSAKHRSGATTSTRPPSQVASATFPGSAGVEASWVVAENQKPGTTAWEIAGSPPGTIAGFSNRVSAQQGDTVTLYVTTNATSFVVQAYRMGWYGGDGARLVWTSASVAGQVQPPCPVSPGTNMVSCDNWAPSVSFTITSAFVQGDYLLKLVGSGGQQSYVPLTVKDPSSTSTYLVKNDVFTWQAWNPYGGYDFYTGLGACSPTYPPCNRARVDSFDRPYGYGKGAGDFLGEDYPLVRFVEEHGLDVTYVTDVDIEQDPSLVLNHKAVLSLGHDECWSLTERRAVIAAHSQGINLIFFGASPILRHVRVQASPLGPDREVVDYRDSAEDPLDGKGDPLEVTGNTWSSPPANWSEVPFVGANYTGYIEPGDRPVPMVVTDAASWLLQGTGLQDGSSIPGALQGDFDQYDPGLSPANVQIFAHSPMPTSETQTNTATPASDITYYTDPSTGAGVFDSGTTEWIPDLSSFSAIDEMTANLLELFGKGPAGRFEPSTPNWRALYG